MALQVHNSEGSTPGRKPLGTLCYRMWLSKQPTATGDSAADHVVDVCARLPGGCRPAEVVQQTGHIDNQNS